MIESEWLKAHVAEHGNRVKFWNYDAKAEAAYQCLHECQDTKMLSEALCDFWGNHLAMPLFTGTCQEVILNLWDCLESDIQDQIDNEELI